MLLGVAGVGGCTQLNTGLAIDGGLVMPALVPEDQMHNAIATPPSAEVPPPSVVSVIRENWEPTHFLVPNAAVEHRAVTSVHPRFTDRATWGTAFPTEQTVFQQPTFRHNARQALEALAAPFYSAADLIMAVPRAVVAHPWTVMESPREAYERTPRRLPHMLPMNGNGDGGEAAAGVAQ